MESRQSDGQIIQKFADAAEIVEIFETPLDIKDPAHPEPLRIAKRARAYRQRSFQYQKDSNDVLTDFTLEIPAGQHVGLVGHSGAGKSTITKLLLRFFGYKNGLIIDRRTRYSQRHPRRLAVQDCLRPAGSHPVSPITA